MTEQPQKAAYEAVCLYAYGLVACSACAPSSLTREQVEEAVNLLSPTGIESPWRVSADPTFHGGGKQPGPCEHAPTERTHYLLEC